MTPHTFAATPHVLAAREIEGDALSAAEVSELLLAAADAGADAGPDTYARLRGWPELPSAAVTSRGTAARQIPGDLPDVCQPPKARTSVVLHALFARRGETT